MSLELTASLEEAGILLDRANGATGRKSSEREKLDGLHCDVCIMTIESVDGDGYKSKCLAYKSSMIGQASGC